MLGTLRAIMSECCAPSNRNGARDHPGIRSLFLPIFIYSKNDKGLPVLGPPRPGPETAAFIEDEAHTDIASVVVALREHHQSTYMADRG